MTERRRRLNPKKHACSIISLGTDQHNTIEQRYINEYKGRGVFAKVNIEKGSFILEYKGRLITGKDADSFGEQDNTYVYYFKHNGKIVCIDATDDDGSFGRLVNDSADPNSKMKKIVLNDTPHLCLFAIKDIRKDEEITYDYGGNNLTWRTTQLAINDDPAFASRNLTVQDHLESDIPINDDPAFASSNVIVQDHLETDIPINDDPAFGSRNLTVQDHLESDIPINDDPAFASRNLTVQDHLESDIPCQKHNMVVELFSGLDKCSVCFGPFAPIRWTGLRCKLCSSVWHKACLVKTTSDEQRLESWISVSQTVIVMRIAKTDLQANLQVELMYPAAMKLATTLKLPVQRNLH
ncbi:uncharacterized protein LOC134301589 [Trichomycterus rosablanca]|uniref:uncharacterized protein LOC134301589 n=1 Tax=Trichomycterus rosablanca TaxID=2290929 RepID=UPI002F357049